MGSKITIAANKARWRYEKFAQAWPQGYPTRVDAQSGEDIEHQVSRYRIAGEAVRTILGREKAAGRAFVSGVKWAAHDLSSFSQATTTDSPHHGSGLTPSPSAKSPVTPSNLEGNAMDAITAPLTKLAAQENMAQRRLGGLKQPPDREDVLRRTWLKIIRPPTRPCLL